MTPIDDTKWKEYFNRLAALARKKLRSLPQSLKNEEDIACSAIKSFLRGVKRNGISPEHEDNLDLWPILATIAAGKCVDLLVYLKTKKRDISKISDAELDEIISTGPGPGSVAEQNEGRQRLLDALKDDRLKKIAQRKMERFTNKEIAQELGVTERTVEREVGLIRVIWDKYVDQVWEGSDLHKR